MFEVSYMHTYTALCRIYTALCDDQFKRNLQSIPENHKMLELEESLDST